MDIKEVEDPATEVVKLTKVLKMKVMRCSLLASFFFSNLRRGRSRADDREKVQAYPIPLKYLDTRFGGHVTSW